MAAPYRPYAPDFELHIPCKPWTGKGFPKRILVIRLQATGDVVITLPYLQHLRQSLPPGVRLDLLTRAEFAPIPRSLVLFDKVFAIGGDRNYKKQWMHTFLLLPRLLWQRYDVVLDLQNTRISEVVRRILFPKAWSVFEKYAPIAAGERNRLTIEALGLGKNTLLPALQVKDTLAARQLLTANGWNGTGKLVVLNPAGAFPTRNWPLPYFVRFAELWLQHFRETKFLILGTALIADKASYFKDQLGDDLIDLTGKTTLAQAFAILQQTSLVLSEDSGLMHMGWASGIPTLALLGGTRSDWVRPLGDNTFFFDSTDLLCGNCMQIVCERGDVYCLKRVTPEMAVEQAMKLVKLAVPA